jgi:hypothetical protein
MIYESRKVPRTNVVADAARVRRHLYLKETTMPLRLQKCCALLIIAILLLAPFAIGVYVFAAPVIGETTTDDAWRPIAPLASLPDDCTPRRFPWFRQDRDAWIRHPDRLAGAVFLRRVPGSDEVLALSATHHATHKVPLRYNRERGVYESACWLDHTYSPAGRYLGTTPDAEDLARYDVRVVGGYVCVAGLGR